MLFEPRYASTFHLFFSFHLCDDFGFSVAPSVTTYIFSRNNQNGHWVVYLIRDDTIKMTDLSIFQLETLSISSCNKVLNGFMS